MDSRALASVEGQAVTHADEMGRRLAEIRADPVLSRRLDALRRGECRAYRWMLDLPACAAIESRRSSVSELVRGSSGN